MRYFESKLNICYDTPNEYYRSHMQALIDDRWDNTTMLYSIEEENPFGSFVFTPIDVHMNHVIDKSTGVKQGNNVRELIFQNLEHTAILGCYYKFDDAYWMVINLDELNRTSKNIMVRRCNNILRWRDEYDGHIIEYPCILEYEATSPNNQVDNDIITPNNHIAMIVQANNDTLNLKVNHRFMFGGRPFKILGYNNYMIDQLDGQQTILYIELGLDEISNLDDIENNIANNDNNNYSIEINAQDFQQMVGYSATLSATVYNNNEIVYKNIKWSSNNNETIAIDDDGNMTILNNDVEQVMITAQLANNTLVKDTIIITIVDNLLDNEQIIISPLIEDIRQNQTIEFNVDLYKDGIKQFDEVGVTCIGAPIDAYALNRDGNKFSLKCEHVSLVPLQLTFEALNTSKTIIVNLKSMF